MNNLKNSFIIALISLFISCTSDDTASFDANAQEADLVGVWNLTEESQDGTVSGVFEGIPLSGKITSTGKDFNTLFTLTQNPNNFIAKGNYNDVIKVSAGPITLYEGEFVIPINDQINQGVWSLNEGILTLTQNNISKNVRITELTATSLKMELDIEDQEVTYDDNTGTVNTTIKMTFIKQ